MKAPLVLTACAAGAIAQPFDLSWHTIDSGGGLSGGGRFTLGSTLGQPDAAGVASGGGFTLTGGFWAAFDVVSACRADIDGDGDADVNDFFLFLDLFARADPRADIDGDGDVDVNDFFAYLDLFAIGC